MYANHQQEYNKSKDITEEGLIYYKSYLHSRLGDGEIEFQEMAQYADFDYKVFYNGQFHHYLECKVRYHHFGKYALEKMPFRKFACAYTVKNIWKCDTKYLLIANDQIGLLDLWEEPDKIEEMVARFDRGDEKDIYALYNKDNFEIIKVINIIKYNYK